MKITIAGTGYVGLVTGVCLAEVGHENVVCLDVDKQKVDLMKDGVSPIYEEHLEELMKKNYEKGRIDYTTNYKDAYKDADIIMIAVGTPERSDGSANLDYIKKVAKQIASSVTKDTLVVVVDTHRPSYTECEELLGISKKIAVIDHHRRGVEFIQDTVLSFHEIYVSSTCEMVTEVVQYLEDDVKIN